MATETLIELLSSWQFIFACIALMLLLPLIFYLASLKPRRKPVLTRPVREKKRPKPTAERPREEEPRRRKAIEDGDEIEYEDKNRDKGREKEQE